MSADQRGRGAVNTDKSWKESCSQRGQNGKVAEGECGIQEGKIFQQTKNTLDNAKQARKVLFKAIGIRDRGQNSSELKSAEVGGGRIFKGW